MKLYRTHNGSVLEHDDRFFALPNGSWDELITRDDLETHLQQLIPDLPHLGSGPLADPTALRSPIGSQEVWAAGVTYYRSRSARMGESKAAGGGDFYDRVYNAERPELFFKSTPSRVVGHQQQVRIRQDAYWSVPEPELALLVSPREKILGYTIGNCLLYTSRCV